MAPTSMLGKIVDNASPPADARTGRDTARGGSQMKRLAAEAISADHAFGVREAEARVPQVWPKPNLHGCKYMVMILTA